jgi:hypothetical protein
MDAFLQAIQDPLTYFHNLVLFCQKKFPNHILKWTKVWIQLIRHSQIKIRFQQNSTYGPKKNIFGITTKYDDHPNLKIFKIQKLLSWAHFIEQLVCELLGGRLGLGMQD